MDMDRIDEIVELGAHRDLGDHPGRDGPAQLPRPPHPLRVVDVGGDPPPPMAGWKDTLDLTLGGPVRIIARFDGQADPDHPYMFHCHILAHEDAGMMGQFVVVDPELK